MQFLHNFLPSGFPSRLEDFFSEGGGGGGERNFLFSTFFSINEPGFKIFLYGQHISMLISYGNESNLIW